jgi:phage tail sheath gpL-like
MSGSSIVSQPRVTIAIEGAQETIGNSPQQILIVGAYNPATATAISGELTQNVPSDDASINKLFGAKSHIAAVARNARKMNGINKIDAIAINATGLATAATATISVVGTPSESGSFKVVVGSYRDHRYEIAVASDDTATTIAVKIVNAVTADTEVQVTAANSSGVVTLTAYDKGVTGNDIPLKIIDGLSVAGIAVTIGASPFSIGAGDICTDSVFDVVGNERYQTVVYPSNSDLQFLTDFLTPRWNADNIILDGLGLIASSDTYANVLAVGAALNSQSVSIIGSKVISDDGHKGSSVVEFLDCQTAQFAGARARRLTDGALIADLIVGASALDNFGGAALASRPLFNTPFQYMPLVDIGKGWSDSEVELLLAAGVSIIGSNRTRTGAIAGEIVTTYKTDAAGNPDESFNFLNKVDTSSQCREFFHNNIKKNFAQTRLTTGSLVPGRPMANEASIRGYAMSLYRELSGIDYALTVSGEASEKIFAQNMTISIDMSLGRVTAVFGKVPLVSQFREFLGTFRVAFDV